MKAIKCILIGGVSLLLVLAATAFFVVHNVSYAPFATLHDLLMYADSYPEFPTTTETNWLNPNYTDFHKTIAPTFSHKLFNRLGIKKQLFWDYASFVALLKKQVAYRKENKLGKLHVTRIQVEAGAKIVLFGHLQGSFHSLVRQLKELQQQGIIDDSLKLTSPNYFIVFLGDVVDRSSYVLETFNLALLLLDKNPEQVFYEQGKHERGFYWKDFGLQRELIQRVARYSVDFQTLENLTADFFESLPLVVYINTPEHPGDTIALSYYGRQEAVIDESSLKSFFEKPATKKITSYSIGEWRETEEFLNVKAMIKSEDWLQGYHAPTGLGMLAIDRGAIAWTVFSSPAMIHQKYLNFFNDAFVVLTVKDPIIQSTLTLYTHDWRKTDAQFIAHTPVNIITAKEVHDGLALKEPIRIGSTMGLGGGGLANLGELVSRGVSVCVNALNLQGGINGHPLEMIILNDNYQPMKARRNVKHLIEDGITTIILPLASAPLESYIDLIKENKVGVLFPISGASQFRIPELKGLVHASATYADTARVFIKKEISDFGQRKFAFFYQDDGSVQGAVDVSHEILKKAGITEWLDVGYARSVLDQKDQAAKIKSFQPGAVGLYSDAYPSQELLREIGVESLSELKLFGIFFAAEQSFINFVDRRGLEFIFGSVVPNPKLSQMELVKEYRELMDSYGYGYDIFSLQGYIATSLLIEALKKLDEPFTHEKIIAEFETYKNKKFKGLTLNFDPETRNLLHSLWIGGNIDDDWEEVDLTQMSD